MADFMIRQRFAKLSLLDYANHNREFFSDVTIVAGNEEIPGNRLILSCYSSYFEGMFKLPMRERYEKTIELNTIDGKVLRALIDFIYAGSINIDAQNVVDLLSGADYLQLHEAKEFCFEFLRSHITVDNAVGILKTADLYRNESLKKEIQQYISINLDKVMQTNDFKQLSKEELVFCISRLDRKQVQEFSIFQAIVGWCSHDQKARERKFPELFKMIQLQKVSLDRLKANLEEKLETYSADYLKIALSAFQKLVKDHNAKLQASKLICLGGKNRTSKVSVVYDIDSDTSVNYPDFPTSLRFHCSLLLNDYVYCLGGDTANQKRPKGTDKVWRLYSKNQTLGWEQVAPMITKRYSMDAAAYGDVIVVAGGVDENNLTVASTEVYQTSLNEWRTISPLNQKRGAHALVSCDGYLYAIGGTYEKPLSSVERLGNLNGEWSNIEPMQRPRTALAAVNCDGVVYAIGGQSSEKISTTLKTIEKYDSSANKWEYVSDMNFNRHDHAACVLRNKIYVVGGLDADNKAVPQIECYDPTCDTWSIVGNTIEELCEHSVVAVQH